jgi:hypothetical protein
MSVDNSKKYKEWAITGAVVAGIAGVSYLLYRSWKGKTPEAADPEVAPVEEKAAAVEADTPSPPKSKKKKKEKKEEPPIEDVTPAGELSRKDLIAMFTEMVEEMSATMYRLTMRIQEMQKVNKTEDEINQFFHKEYTSSIEAAHASLLYKYKTTEEAADAAAQKYQDDPELKRLLNQIEKLQRTLSGQQPGEEELEKVPDWLDMAKVIEIFTEVMTTVTQSIIYAMETVYQKYEGQDVLESIKEKEIQSLYKKTIEERKTSVFAKHQIDESLLDLGLLKFSNNPQLSQAIMKMQQKQKMEVDEARKRVKNRNS